jgi:hypothetical protein
MKYELLKILLGCKPEYHKMIIIHSYYIQLNEVHFYVCDLSSCEHSYMLSQSKYSTTYIETC